MGAPKALLPFQGEPLVARVVGILQPLFPRVLVVAAPGQELPPVGADVVRDDLPGQGPLRGLVTGLRAAGGGFAFVASCDAPFLVPALVAFVVSAAAGSDAAVPRWAGRMHPLHAAYRVGILPVAEDQLARGELRLTSLLDRIRTSEIDEATIRRFDPEGWSFVNVNTPGEYAEALARRQARRGEP